MVQRTVYSTVRYVIVQRIVYSIVKYNVCDSKGKNWYIKHCYLEYNQIQQDFPISVFHMKKSVQKTITDIFISESVKLKKTNLAIFCKSHNFLFSMFKLLVRGCHVNFGAAIFARGSLWHSLTSVCGNDGLIVTFIIFRGRP